MFTTCVALFIEFYFKIKSIFQLLKQTRQLNEPIRCYKKREPYLVTRISNGFKIIEYNCFLLKHYYSPIFLSTPDAVCCFWTNRERNIHSYLYTSVCKWLPVCHIYVRTYVYMLLCIDSSKLTLSASFSLNVYMKKNICI